MARLLLLRGQGFSRRRPLHRRLAMTRPRYGPIARSVEHVFIRAPASRLEETTMSEYEALAKNVIRRPLHIQPKENVIVECWNHGLPIATEVVYQALSAGARPTVRFQDEATYGVSGKQRR